MCAGLAGLALLVLAQPTLERVVRPVKRGLSSSSQLPDSSAGGCWARELEDAGLSDSRHLITAAAAAAQCLGELEDAE